MRAVNSLFHDLDEVEFEKAMDTEDNLSILDVRTPKEYEDGHLPGAVNYDISHPEFPRWLQQLSRERPYFVYCRSGARSLTACQLLATLGFTTIYNLRDGIISWTGDLEAVDAKGRERERKG